MNNLNPELLKAAAQMARPGRSWVISDGIVMDDDLPEFYTDWFSPLTSDADAWLLCESLEREGWVVSHTPVKPVDGHDYWCAKHYAIHDVTADSKRELLIACVSAQTGIPMNIPMEGGV